MRTLVIIPARAGSKGLPGKNWKPFRGKPLLLHSLDMALRFFSIENIVVSTDSLELAALVQPYLFNEFEMRPASLAQDQTSMQEVLLYELEKRAKKGFFYDSVLLLQPTSPLRREQDIQNVLEQYDEDVDMVVTVASTKHNPYSVLLEKNQSGDWMKCKAFEATNRQSVPAVKAINGAVYLMAVRSLQQKSISAFTKLKLVEMPEHLSIDIDTEWDWKVAELAYDCMHDANKKAS